MPKEVHYIYFEPVKEPWVVCNGGRCRKKAEVLAELKNTVVCTRCENMGRWREFKTFHAFTSHYWSIHHKKKRTKPVTDQDLEKYIDPV